MNHTPDPAFAESSGSFDPKQAAALLALIKDWQIVCTMLAIAIAATVAGFGGPAGAWLILGIEMCAVCLGTAAFKFSQRHRSAVRP